MPCVATRGPRTNRNSAVEVLARHPVEGKLRAGFAIRNANDGRPHLAHSFRTGTGRYDPFRKPSANDRYLRTAECGNRQAILRLSRSNSQCRRRRPQPIALLGPRRTCASSRRTRKRGRLFPRVKSQRRSRSGGTAGSSCQLLYAQDPLVGLSPSALSEVPAAKASAMNAEALAGPGDESRFERLAPFS